MKNLPSAEEARQWLIVQLELLTELKNSNARDSGFQQWRNNTIALAERIWPHQAAKYKRFRRVPFQPSSVKADDRARRESFEKGCAEARRLLQLWIAEINLHGLLHGGEGSGPPDPMPDLGDAPSSDVPGQRRSSRASSGGSQSGLGGGTRGNAPGTGHVPRGRAFGVGRGSSGRQQSAAQPKKSKPRLKDMLGLGDDGEAAPEAPPEAEPPRIPSAPRPTPPRLETPPKPSIPLLRQPETPAPPPAGEDLAIERLERPSPADTGPDVLERSIFDAMQAARNADTETNEPEPAEASKESKSKQEDEPEAEVPEAHATPETAEKEEAPAEPEPEPMKEPAGAEVSTQEPEEETPEPEAEAATTSTKKSDETEEESAIEAPVASKSDDVPEPPGAIVEIVRLASDLDLLGVPEQEARPLRAALLEVGRTLDSDAPEWNALQVAITLAVCQPVVARKLLPLLMPYLDQAA